MLTIHFSRKKYVKIFDRCFFKIMLLSVLIISFQNCSGAKFREVAVASSANENFIAPVTESSVPTPKNEPQIEPQPSTSAPVVKAINKISCTGSYDLVVWTDNHNNGLLEGNTPVAAVKAVAITGLDRPKLTSPGINIYAAKFKSSESATNYIQAVGIQGNSIPETSCMAIRTNNKTINLLFGSNSGQTGQDIIGGLLADDNSYIWCKFASTSQNSVFNIYNEKQKKISTVKASSIIITNNCGKHSQ